MCDCIDVELSHHASRALDRANRAGLVEKVREVGDVHGEARAYPPWKALETRRSIAAPASGGGKRQNQRSLCAGTTASAAPATHGLSAARGTRCGVSHPVPDNLTHGNPKTL